MWKHVRNGVLLAVVSGLIPMALTESTASAQLFGRRCRQCGNSGHSGHCGHQCNSCQRPVAQCQCTAQQPVVETQMVPQQTTVLRNEVVTQYRQEAVTQNVPVTTYRNVVVDEGGYQMVYVPKPVAKQVPQVTYQQQVAYRTVPFQVTRQVPQVVTQMVPQQIVRQQTYSYQTAQVAPITAPCGSCGGVAYGTAPIYSGVPMLGQSYYTTPSMASPFISNPVTMLTPTTTAAAPIPMHGEADSHANPVPDPKFLESPGAARESWTTIGTRQGSRSETSNYDDSRTSNSGSTRFKPARTVYRSWETQSRTAAGDGAARQ